MSKRTRARPLEHGKSLTVIAKDQSMPSPIDKELDDLYSMLNYMRPAGSKAEMEFIQRFIEPLGAKPDFAGNYHLLVLEKDGSHSPVLWSSHTDTVHTQTGHQKLIMNEFGMLMTDNGSCLGADDGAGVWLMTRMIKAEVPGLYVFHRQEEIGGHGSRAIAKLSRDVRNKRIAREKITNTDAREVIDSFLANNKDPLEGIKYAIAFDRKGIGSIITHQGARCCSNEFADSLALELDDGEYIKLSKDSGGTFTDTANYTSLVPECTNISVGYYAQHTRNETLNTQWLKKLLGSLVQLDWRNLVEKRDPNERPEYRWSGYGHGGYANDDWSDYEDYWNNRGTSTNQYTRIQGGYKKKDDLGSEEMLEEFGYDYTTLEMEIKSRGGNT